MNTYIRSVLVELFDNCVEQAGKELPGFAQRPAWVLVEQAQVHSAHHNLTAVTLDDAGIGQREHCGVVHSLRRVMPGICG